MKVTLEFESGEASEIEVLDKIAEMIKCNVPCGMAIRGDNAGKNVTGYERVAQDEKYYIEVCNGETSVYSEFFDDFDCKQYEGANYYSDESIAENNARADKLYRQLRRFAVEQRKEKIDWNDGQEKKFYIYYDYYNTVLSIARSWGYKGFGVLYFDSCETAQLAIDTFKDELIWYFTEYKDSL